MILQFRCEHCKLDFESKPDGTGYEQAPCPECGYLSMTIEFLEEKAPPLRFSLRTLIIVLTIFAVVLVCCLPIWHRHAGMGGGTHGHPIWEWNHRH